MKETMEYLMLRDSVKEVGILQPILVRQRNEVVLGGHRFEIACDLRLETIPCLIRELDDSEVLRLQIVENSNRIETRPQDYYRRLQRIIHRQEMTVEELAFSVHKHPDWVRKLLRLNYLSPKAKNELDKGNLSCILGIELANLPIDRQDQLLSLHSEYPGTEYLELLRREVRDFRGGRKQGRVQQKVGLGPTFRQFRKVKDEYLNPTEKATVLTRRDAKTASQGWDAAFEWILSSDEQTMAERVARKERGDALEAKRSNLRDLELSRRKANEQ
jgi:ParB/RepB/Spo0J family partition protein